MSKIGKKKCVSLARKLAHKTGVCSRCGRTKDEVQIQASHIIPEEHDWLACSFDNMIELCASCHKFGRNSWHKHPLLMAEWFHEKYPERYAALLRHLSATTDKKIDWEVVYAELKSEEKRRKKNASK